MYNFNKTIAAISTPRGKGGIATIRISGSDAARIADSMFIPKSGRRLTDYSARVAVFGTILDSCGEPCDEGVAVLYRAPASFTGEDSAEISCHGGVAVTNEVLMSAISHGAAMAGAGEFTRRAFMSGKLSLTEAEAVGRLIEADTRERMTLSAAGLRGNVSRELSSISESLLGTMTALYAAIDYPEEDVGDEGEREIAGTLSSALERVEKLLGTYKVGRAVSDGVRCTICGKPNVGKSSVFNLITGDESAIVTEIAGTTRDILRETVSFGGITLRLSDTAGLRDSDDTVERMGIGRAEAEIESSELIIAVFDVSRALSGEDRALLGRLGRLSQPKIAVINKSDLSRALSIEDEALIRRSATAAVEMSALTGDTSALSSAVAEIFGSGDVDLREDAVIWDIRQRELLEHSRSSLRSAVAAIESGDPLDCVCTLAEEALAFLNETDGRSIDEKIVSEIFARFCVGK